jgi:hypothetical protein
MKILKGSLKETLYDWPDKSLIQQGQCSPPAIVKETIYNLDQVAYISGEHLLSHISSHLSSPRWLLGAEKHHDRIGTFYPSSKGRIIPGKIVCQIARNLSPSSFMRV